MSASIKSIFLEDFQSHAKTKLELAPPGELTVIVGPTDSGKTAIVRALRLLFYNVPQGADYVRVGRNMATVAVELADGTKVVRERSKSVNRYRIVESGQQPRVLEGFGLSVPQEVQEATGVRTVTIGDTIDLALNLSEQLDGPFLGKAVSGPAKAKILGSLAGTEEVDKAQQTVQLDLHRATQDEKRIADEIAILDTKVAEYDYLPRLAEQIESLDSILATVKETQTRLYSLEVAKAKLNAIHEQRTQMLSVLARWGGLSQAISHVEYAEGALSKLEHLYWASFKLSDMQGEREAQQGWLARLAGIEGAAAIADGIPALVARVTTLRQHRDELHSILGARVVAEHNLDRHTKALHDAEVSYVEVLAQSGICPLCGSTVDPESIKSHIKEVA